MNFFVYTSFIFSRFFLLKLKLLEELLCDNNLVPFVYVFRESRVVFLSIRHSHFKVARLDSFGGYLPSLSINYVAMSKDIEKNYHNCII